MLGFGPTKAKADIVESVNNNKQLSPDFYAQDLEAQRTLSRLEKKGFNLDTEEERTIRLNDALSSFSYESATSPKPKSATIRKPFSSSKVDSKLTVSEKK